MHRVPRTRCPVCNIMLDAATNMDETDNHPSPGDYTFCFMCFTIMSFNEDLTLHAMSEVELAQMPIECRMSLENGIVEAMSYRLGPGKSNA